MENFSPKSVPSSISLNFHSAQTSLVNLLFLQTLDGQLLQAELHCYTILPHCIDGSEHERAISLRDTS